MMVASTVALTAFPADLRICPRISRLDHRLEGNKTGSEGVRAYKRYGRRRFFAREEISSDERGFAFCSPRHGPTLTIGNAASCTLVRPCSRFPPLLRTRDTANNGLLVT